MYEVISKKKLLVENFDIAYPLKNGGLKTCIFRFPFSERLQCVNKNTHPNHRKEILNAKSSSKRKLPKVLHSLQKNHQNIKKNSSRPQVDPTSPTKVCQVGALYRDQGQLTWSLWNLDILEFSNGILPLAAEGRVPRLDGNPASWAL